MATTLAGVGNGGSEMGGGRGRGRGGGEVEGAFISCIAVVIQP